MATALPVTTQWLRAGVVASPQSVDRRNARINGYVVAQLGPFKTPGRGEFTHESLTRIVALMKEARGGLKIRFGHPTLSEDGLAKFLGRGKSPRLDGDLVRADLHFDRTAFTTPHGDLATYVMDLVESDSDAVSSSLVVKADQMIQRDRSGKVLVDEDGDPLPPIWLPTELHASDVVEVGDAVDGFLSADGLPDHAVRAGTELLDQAFAGQSREVVQARCLKWLDRYLDLRFEQSRRLCIENVETYAESFERDRAPDEMPREAFREGVIERLDRYLDLHCGSHESAITDPEAEEVESHRKRIETMGLTVAGFNS